MATAKEVAFNQIYLPVFRKVAADHGFPLETDEALQEALDLTANARQLAAATETSNVKQASLAMKRALGVKVQPAPRYDFSKSAAELANDPKMVELALAL